MHKILGLHQAYSSTSGQLVIQKFEAQYFKTYRIFERMGTFSDDMNEVEKIDIGKRVNDHHR